MIAGFVDTPNSELGSIGNPQMRKRSAALALLVVVTAAVLSVFWRVPYIFTLIGYSGWAFVGHLVTADDDLPGGWSNPTGTFSLPGGELALKGAIFAVLCGAALLFPVVRTFGVGP